MRLINPGKERRLRGVGPVAQEIRKLSFREIYRPTPGNLNHSGSGSLNPATTALADYVDASIMLSFLQQRGSGERVTMGLVGS
jgi:hypothetical protein